MYRENLVVAIKVNGIVLREVAGEVALPFGCEYSVLIKNLNSVRVQAKVLVDGIDAADGSLIIPANSDVEMERFIRNGNLTSGNRFKFIERTAQIEEYRGIKVDDGIVRVEGWREQIPTYTPPKYYPTPAPARPPWRKPPPPMRPMSGASSRPGGPRPQHPTSRGRLGSLQARSAPSSARSASLGRSYVPPRPDMFAAASAAPEGITVPGSESNQQFFLSHGFPVEPQSTVLVLRLKGEIGEAPVMEPVTVERQNLCLTCGKNNRHKNKFCFSCGTALQLI